jgi:hypothetical protein
MDPIKLGSTVKPYGTVVGVGMISGERYYWFTDHRGVVSMMPAIVVETIPATNKERR